MAAIAVTASWTCRLNATSTSFVRGRGLRRDDDAVDDTDSLRLRFPDLENTLALDAPFFSSSLSMFANDLSSSSSCCTGSIFGLSS